MNFNQDTSSPIRFNPGKDSNYKSNSDVGTRPTGDPKSRKDFKKVLEKTSDEEEEADNATKGINEEGGDEVVAMEAMIGKKKAPASLFDLSGSKAAQAAQQAAQLAQDGTAKVVSPTDVYAKMSTGKKPAADPDSTLDEPAYAPVVEKDKFTNRFATEQTDLSYVNPIAAMTPQPVVTPEIKTEKPVIPVSNIQAIINQLVEKVTELKDSGRTETTVTLKHPPLFAGVNIVVTAFDTAKGEFNISFENLTQAAKALLDRQANRDSLLLALEQKGYAVHIVSTTTIIEHRPIIAEAQPQRNPDRENPDQQQQRQQQRRQQKDDQ